MDCFPGLDPKNYAVFERTSSKPKRGKTAFVLTPGMRASSSAIAKSRILQHSASRSTIMMSKRPLSPVGAKAGVLDVVTGSSAQQPVIRRGLGERVISAPLLPFAGREESARAVTRRRRGERVKSTQTAVIDGLGSGNPGPLARQPLRRPDGSPASGCGADVLVHTEKVRRIVYFLHAREPVVVAAVGGPDPGIALVVHHEVRVGAGQIERMDGRPIVLRPLLERRRLGRIRVTP